MDLPANSSLSSVQVHSFARYVSSGTHFIQFSSVLTPNGVRLTFLDETGNFLSEEINSQAVVQTRYNLDAPFPLTEFNFICPFTVSANDPSASIFLDTDIHYGFPEDFFSIVKTEDISPNSSFLPSTPQPSAAARLVQQPTCATPPTESRRQSISWSDPSLRTWSPTDLSESYESEASFSGQTPLDSTPLSIANSHRNSSQLLNSSESSGASTETYSPAQLPPIVQLTETDLTSTFSGL